MATDGNGVIMEEIIRDDKLFRIHSLEALSRIEKKIDLHETRIQTIENWKIECLGLASGAKKTAALVAGLLGLLGGLIVGWLKK